MNSNIKEALLTQGKEVTVNLKVINKNLAEDLLCTMYDKNKDKFGVEIVSWGFYDIQKAQAIRIKLMSKTTHKYQADISNIETMTDSRLLEMHSDLI